MISAEADRRPAVRRRYPMAGLETTGYAAADGRLFIDRPWPSSPAPTPNPPTRVASRTLPPPARRGRGVDAAAHDRAGPHQPPPLLVAASLAESREPAADDRATPSGSRPVAGGTDAGRPGRSGDGRGHVATNARGPGAAWDLRLVPTAGWPARVPRGPDEHGSRWLAAARRAGRPADRRAGLRRARDAVPDGRAGTFGRRHGRLVSSQRDGRYEPRDRMELTCRASRSSRLVPRDDPGSS